MTKIKQKQKNYTNMHFKAHLSQSHEKKYSTNHCLKPGLENSSLLFAKQKQYVSAW